MRSRAALSVLGLVLAGSLAACGSNSDGDVEALSEAQLEDVMVDLDALGDGFRVDEDDEDDDEESGFGCLKGVDEVDGDNEAEKPLREAEEQFESDSELTLPGVFTTAGSLPSEAAAKKGLAEMRKVLAGCTSIDETDEDGSVISMEVTSDDDRSGPGLDDQLNLAARGTIELDGIRAPMSFHFSVLRIDNHVSMVGLVTVAEDASADADELAAVARDRFVAVVAGEPVPDRTLEIEPVDTALFERTGNV